MTNLLIELMNIDDSLDFLKDFPFSISPDVNVLFPFSSCTGAYAGLVRHWDSAEEVLPNTGYWTQTNA
jgi:hypothetical protein